MVERYIPVLPSHVCVRANPISARSPPAKSTRRQLRQKFKEQKGSPLLAKPRHVPSSRGKGVLLETSNYFYAPTCFHACATSSRMRETEERRAKYRQNRSDARTGEAISFVKCVQADNGTCSGSLPATARRAAELASRASYLCVPHCCLPFLNVCGVYLESCAHSRAVSERVCI